MRRDPLIVGLWLFVGLAVVVFLAGYAVTRVTEGSGPGMIATGDQIGLVRIEGVLFDVKETLDELRRYQEDPAIRAIVVRIDSPGGAVVPAQEIYSQIQKARTKGKRVVASMGLVAASGGYYIASATEKIVSNPGTITGSIGVIMHLSNVEGLMKKIGVESVTLKSGTLKDSGSPFRKMLPAERRAFQQVLDDIHAQFIEAVATGRGLPVEKVRAIADGRVFTGRQAKAIGLVDELGDLQDAVKLTATLAGITGEPRVIEPRRPFSLTQFLRSQAATLIGLPGLQAPGPVSLQYLMW